MDADAVDQERATQKGMSCGYCGGVVVLGSEGYVHAEDGDRVPPPTSGDFVSDRHNWAGTRVLAVDVVDDDD